ncbi:hypothetical protein BRADI_3g21575v3 [Brachypodium distachyon]|uniref:Uncharacterized protein n=1 Tax=Brachypodium distachyon TaxID=15368 RepID=A0A0Q3F8T9_BRADI|nr:hypothetical protein BRADI_3g21575v3 [Brachypodium distachyon]
MRIPMLTQVAIQIPPKPENDPAQMNHELTKLQQRGQRQIIWVAAGNVDGDVLLVVGDELLDESTGGGDGSGRGAGPGEERRRRSSGRPAGAADLGRRVRGSRRQGGASLVAEEAGRPPERSWGGGGAAAAAGRDGEQQRLARVGRGEEEARGSGDSAVAFGPSAA